MSIMMYMLKHMKQSAVAPVRPCVAEIVRLSYSDDTLSPRMKEFREKLKTKTPIGKLDELEGKHPYEEKEPLPAWPDNTNPHTGEIGGPKGPEPTRYGDWERKGRVSDF